MLTPRIVSLYRKAKHRLMGPTGTAKDRGQHDGVAVAASMPGLKTPIIFLNSNKVVWIRLRD
jgi:hypothetical protein